MGKIIIIPILMLLILVAAAKAGTRFSDKSNIVEELESFDIEEEEESELFDIAELLRSERGSKVLVNVDSFGAAGDGVSDDTKV